jgi:hypothetical protein
MPDPAAVGRALAALADPERDEFDQRRPYESTIADARDAFADTAAAADFLDDGGEIALRRAVGAATRDGHRCARAGREVLRDLDRLRTTLDGANSSVRDDHFHSGRTTVFSGDGESAGR